MCKRFLILSLLTLVFNGLLSQPKVSSIVGCAFKSNSTVFHSNNISSNHKSSWIPKRAEYYFLDENKVAANIYYEIGQNNIPYKRVITSIDNHSVYDSTVVVMNASPYAKGKNLDDTVYNYSKNADGTYRLDRRITYSYHYFDYFEGDSLFYEGAYHNWDNITKQWINVYKSKIGYYDTIVQFANRYEDYVGNAQSNTWQLATYVYDSISHNDNGFVDSIYRISNIGDGRVILDKAGIINDVHGCPAQINFYNKKGSMWIEGSTFFDITFKEWNGFVYWGQERLTIGGEMLSPYNKRTKVASYLIKEPGYNPSGQLLYKKFWDINNTLSNSDAHYIDIDGVLYFIDAIENEYDEHGYYVSWRNKAYTLPDENGIQKLHNYNAIYNNYIFDEEYGLIESKTFDIRMSNGAIDSTFFEGIKYIEFIPASINSYTNETKNSLKIAPNPAKSIVNIYSTEKIIQLSFFDINGNLVHNEFVDNNTVYFNSQTLKEGVYIVQAITHENSVLSGKLIVIR